MLFKLFLLSIILVCFVVQQIKAQTSNKAEISFFNADNCYNSTNSITNAFCNGGCTELMRLNTSMPISVIVSYFILSRNPALYIHV
jgi:hypothetical protein